MNIYDFTLTTGKGQRISLGDYRGKVMLIVNTATGCGFTPHYEDIEALYEKYHESGLEVIDIPCNQFLNQAPGTDEEIQQFCTLNYHTQFAQMKKSDVNGENELPLYTYLKSKKGFGGFCDGPFTKILDDLLSKADPNYKLTPDIKWNFTKFIIDREGNVAARFEPTDGMEKVGECIKSLL
ncbi:MAG: glutathione peroxidase [Clostridia bacterium]|nr:glutathione peroxidase [Clostridia bacterium]MBR6408280.1 glutathione peroxidase [Clostridia bacterium]